MTNALLRRLAALRLRRRYSCLDTVACGERVLISAVDRREASRWLLLSGLPEQETAYVVGRTPTGHVHLRAGGLALRVPRWVASAVRVTVLGGTTDAT